MTSIPDCLAAFSVAAMVNSPDAEAKGNATVDAYLACCPPEPARQLAALHELRAAFTELALDSTAALTIQGDIESRIAALLPCCARPVVPSRAVRAAAESNLGLSKALRASVGAANSGEAALEPISAWVVDRSRIVERSSMSCVVLVVEDDPTVRMVAVDIAEETAEKVYAAENAEAAIRVLEAHPDVTLLFTDIDMPGTIDGLDLAEIVHERWPKVRLIVTSGGSRLRNDQIPDDGRFIGKPYYAETIKSAIREAHSA